jgi:hypothetical protein
VPQQLHTHEVISQRLTGLQAVSLW